MVNLVLLLLGLSLLGCSSNPQKLDPNLFYRRDISLKINNKDYEGVAVAPVAARYIIEIRPKATMDLVLITSCHREYSGEKLSPGWFGTNKFVYEYIPIPGLEDGPSCELRINVYEKSKGRHSWALIVMEHPEHTLPARLSCNGEIIISNGTSVCQSKKGLYQSIAFDEPVIFSPDPGCELPKLVDNRIEFPINGGECVTLFKGSSNRYHKLVTIGYEGILVRSAAD